ncbi:hypothetical protein BC826DRAFT_967027 [Russula brevipes]|nr:hypothetical protein BC826DRAFT_967027 [Russula brevipes]
MSHNYLSAYPFILQRNNPFWSARRVPHKSAEPVIIAQRFCAFSSLLLRIPQGIRAPRSSIPTIDIMMVPAPRNVPVVTATGRYYTNPFFVPGWRRRHLPRGLPVNSLRPWTPRRYSGQRGYHLPVFRCTTPPRLSSGVAKQVTTQAQAIRNCDSWGSHDPSKEHMTSVLRPKSGDIASRGESQLFDFAFKCATGWANHVSIHTRLASGADDICAQGLTIQGASGSVKEMRGWGPSHMGENAEDFPDGSFRVSEWFSQTAHPPLPWKSRRGGGRSRNIQ